MIVRVVLALGLLVALCSSARADYTTTVLGGHGPFVCERDGGGVLPDRGFAELFSGDQYTGLCKRYQGDFTRGSSYVGFGMWVDMDVRSVRVSPAQNTGVYVCEMGWHSNDPAPCIGRQLEASGSNPLPSISIPVSAVVIGYAPPCPLTPGMVAIHVCSGSFTPMDGSALPTAVISDGLSQGPCPGPSCLPYGHPLNLPGNTNDVSCIATMSNYPAVPHPASVMAGVYDCP